MATMKESARLIKSKHSSSMPRAKGHNRKAAATLKQENGRFQTIVFDTPANAVKSNLIKTVKVCCPPRPKLINETFIDVLLSADMTATPEGRKILKAIKRLK